MYEALTAFIPFMKGDHFGDWNDKTGDGAQENPSIMSYIAYDEPIIRLNRTLYQFEKEHTEFDLFHYPDILEKGGINLDHVSLSTMDVSTLDGTTILAMIRLVFSMERFSDGTVLEYCQNGCFLRWLLRLKEIDDADKAV